jgi:hypothetical protein
MASAVLRPSVLRSKLVPTFTTRRLMRGLLQAIGRIVAPTPEHDRDDKVFRLLLRV